ncbi:MAG: hypothetical protein QM774_11790 [Gordonia sp. (in: high G+C Gram-positive bacteria)]|uniref:hypothetical protein n=1 Tax=Gordonia sp. (in: high G+C Gram-positive bacteria) TaxID=84139 RepID=UPI0039E6E4B3
MAADRCWSSIGLRPAERSALGAGQSTWLANCDLPAEHPGPHASDGGRGGSARRAWVLWDDFANSAEACENLDPCPVRSIDNSPCRLFAGHVSGHAFPPIPDSGSWPTPPTPAPQAAAPQAPVAPARTPQPAPASVPPSAAPQSWPNAAPPAAPQRGSHAAPSVPFQAQTPQQSPAPQTPAPQSPVPQTPPVQAPVSAPQPVAQPSAPQHSGSPRPVPPTPAPHYSSAAPQAPVSRPFPQATPAPMPPAPDPTAPQPPSQPPSRPFVTAPPVPAAPPSVAPQAPVTPPVAAAPVDVPSPTPVIPVTPPRAPDLTITDLAGAEPVTEGLPMYDVRETPSGPMVEINYDDSHASFLEVITPDGTNRTVLAPVVRSGPVPDVPMSVVPSAGLQREHASQQLAKAAQVVAAMPDDAVIARHEVGSALRDVATALARLAESVDPH